MYIYMFSSIRKLEGLFAPGEWCVLFSEIWGSRFLYIPVVNPAVRWACSGDTFQLKSDVADWFIVSEAASAYSLFCVYPLLKKGDFWMCKVLC